MSESDPPPIPCQIIPPPTVLDYATVSANGIYVKPRRWWAFVILGIYLLLVACLLAMPVLLVLGNSDLPVTKFVAVAVALLIICGLAMLLTPVRVARRRPMTRRSILIPVIASGFLLGGLALGGGFALAELCAPAASDDVSEISLWAVVAGAAAVWIAWSVVLIVMTRQGDPTGLGMKLHRILIAGSFLELVVAVPCHLIVRQRTVCCAGILTAMGIIIGIVIALVSFGPAVLLLYYQRCRRITNH